MSSPWQGGENFIMVPSGGKSKHNNSGPTGKAARKFRNFMQNPDVQSKRDKERQKTLPRVVVKIPSGFRKFGVVV